MLDTEALAAATAAIVREHVDAATTPLKAEIKTLTVRLAEIEARAPAQGEPGKDADPALIADAVERAVAAIPPAADAVGVAGAVIDRSGNLVLTLSNGTQRDLGRVVGTDADEDRIERQITEAVAALPKPRDGFSLDNFDTKLLEDGRTLRMSFSSGDDEYVHEMHFPVVLYRDVYVEGQEYAAGDAVTWGGSLWIAQRDTSGKPDGADSGFRLAVKRGRDGKDAPK
jgi:hypothetical protein